MNTKFKTHDLKINDELIMLTGNGFLADNHSAYILETEYSYPNFSEYNKYFKDLLFENFVVIPMNKYLSENFVERVRPEGFVSNACNAKEAELDNKINMLHTKYSNFLNRDIYKFDIKGGVTLSPTDCVGCAFSLEPPKKVQILEREVIKRLELSEKVLDELLYSESIAEQFFEQVNKEMKELGCKSYTFEIPRAKDGLKLRREPFRKYTELRIYGYTE